MDFEKEARKIAWGQACGDCEGVEGAACEETGGCVYLAAEITKALLRAHRQGQEEMRERAKAICLTKQYEPSSAFDKETDCYNEGCFVCANAIADLPLSIEEDK